MKDASYKKLLQDISVILEKARGQVVHNVNIIIVKVYWEIGKRIVLEEQKGERRAQYGEMLLNKLSSDLAKKFGKGFSPANIWNMRQFYVVYPKLYALRRESEKGNIFELSKRLSWTHFRILMRLDDSKVRKFYEIETIKNNWSSRELERQIDSLLFERLSLSRDKKKVIELSHRGQIIEKPEDAIKSPYVLEFLGIPEKSYYTESLLEQRLIDHLQEFILELGKGFSFIGRQKRITIDNEHYYIDLVFYHRILRCLVLIDLKVGILSHADVGQMNFYLNYIKDNEMMPEENPPVGIILCTERKRSRVFVEYALGGLNNKIFVSKYKLYLPTKKELEAEIRKESLRLTGGKGD